MEQEQREKEYIESLSAMAGDLGKQREARISAENERDRLRTALSEIWGTLKPPEIVSEDQWRPDWKWCVEVAESVLGGSDG